MSEDLVSGLGSFWLVLGVAVFGLIVWRVYKPSRRKEMKEHAEIPFREEEAWHDMHRADETREQGGDNKGSNRKGHRDGEA